jgi:hypothetical protein
VASLVAGVRDDESTAPTPRTDASVGDVSGTSTASRYRSPPRATKKPLHALGNECVLGGAGRQPRHTA